MFVNHFMIWSGRFFTRRISNAYGSYSEQSLQNFDFSYFRFDRLTVGSCYGTVCCVSTAESARLRNAFEKTNVVITPEWYKFEVWFHAGVNLLNWNGFTLLFIIDPQASPSMVFIIFDVL